MRLVIFDCDGTLVDSQHAIIQAVDAALSAHGFAVPPRADILRTVGLHPERAFEIHAPLASDAQRAAMITIYQNVSIDLARRDDRGQVIFDGMYELIHALHGETNTLLGIITMKSRRGLLRVVEAYAIADYFRILKSADDGPGKPSPVLLFDAMREAGVEAQDTIMIGDSSFDMLMAKAAGVYAIGVSWGYQTASELEEAGADEVVHTAVELKNILKI